MAVKTASDGWGNGWNIVGELAYEITLYIAFMLVNIYNPCYYLYLAACSLGACCYL